MPTCSCPPGTAAEQYPSTAAPQHRSRTASDCRACNASVGSPISSHLDTPAQTLRQTIARASTPALISLPRALGLSSAKRQPTTPSIREPLQGRWGVSLAMPCSSPASFPGHHHNASLVMPGTTSPTHPISSALCQSVNPPPPLSPSSIPTYAHAAALAGTQTQDTTMPSLAE
jgi:hypothetical protein